jgi:hypothetical protein
MFLLVSFYTNLGYKILRDYSLEEVFKAFAMAINAFGL